MGIIEGVILGFLGLMLLSTLCMFLCFVAMVCFFMEGALDE